MLGGMIEGVIAEYSPNQWWDFNTVVVHNIAMRVHIVFFALLS